MRQYFLFLLLFPAFLSAQTFFPVGPPLLTQEVVFEQANECYIYFDNPSGDSIRLVWRRIETSIPSGWDIDLCDYGACYIGIPDNAVMNHVYDSIQPYIKLVVQPDTVPGSAWLWFRVQELDNASNFQDVYFNLHTSGTTSVLQAYTGVITAYPNPVADVLYLQNKSADPQGYFLFSSSGQLVSEGSIPAAGQSEVHVSAIPSGSYYLQTAGQTKQILIQTNH
jgi:hypothetical protein